MVITYPIVLESDLQFTAREQTCHVTAKDIYFEINDFPSQRPSKAKPSPLRWIGCIVIKLLITNLLSYSEEKPNVCGIIQSGVHIKTN